MNTLRISHPALALVACLTTTGALAQNTGAGAGADATPDGARIASQGAGGAVAACASCHGAQGEGNAAAGFPRLAGQSAWYLDKQLHNYADGSRDHPVMTPIAKGLNPAQRAAVAGYYASLEAASAKAGSKGAAAAAGTKTVTAGRGATLAAVGDDQIGVQSCANCHGPGGVGEAPAYPYLAGQHASYLSATLTNWKNGTRNTDPSQQMPSIAKRLSDADIAALATYYAQQRPPAAAELQPNLAAGTVARPVGATAVQSGPSGSATPKQGVGVEQGSPTQGGSQGIGGGGGASGSGPQGSQTGAGSNAPGPATTPPKRP